MKKREKIMKILREAPNWFEKMPRSSLDEGMLSEALESIEKLCSKSSRKKKKK